MAQEEYNPKREQLKEKSPGPRSILDRAKNTVSNPPNNPNNPGNPNLNFSRLVTTSTGDSISKDRSRQVKRDDTVKDVAVGLYDADEAIHYYFENVIQPRVTEGQKEIFLGGCLPVAKNISQINKNITLISMFNDKSILLKLKKFFSHNKINLKLFRKNGFKDIYKKKILE